MIIFWIEIISEDKRDRFSQNMKASYFPVENNRPSLFTDFCLFAIINKIWNKERALKGLLKIGKGDFECFCSSSKRFVHKVLNFPARPIIINIAFVLLKYIIIVVLFSFVYLRFACSILMKGCFCFVMILHVFISILFFFF